MDEYRPRRLPASEQFIGMFSSPSPSPSSSPTEPSFVARDEFHEDDFLFSASPAASSDTPPDGSGSPSRVPQGHLGLLAALHEGDKRLLVRPPSPSAFLPLGTRNLVRSRWIWPRSRRICLPSFGHASVATGLPSTSPVSRATTSCSLLFSLLPRPTISIGHAASVPPLTASPLCSHVILHPLSMTSFSMLPRCSMKCFTDCIRLLFLDSSAREHGCDARVEMRYAWLQRRRLYGYDRKGSGKTSLLSIQRVQLANTRKAPSQSCPTEERGAPVQHRQQRKEVETYNCLNEGLQCRWLNVVLVQIHSPLLLQFFRPM